MFQVGDKWEIRKIGLFEDEKTLKTVEIISISIDDNMRPVIVLSDETGQNVSTTPEKLKEYLDSHINEYITAKESGVGMTASDIISKTGACDKSKRFALYMVLMGKGQHKLVEIEPQKSGGPRYVWKDKTGNQVLLTKAMVDTLMSNKIVSTERQCPSCGQARLLAVTDGDNRSDRVLRMACPECAASFTV